MNLQGKLQKHQAFVSELNANESRINGIKEKGKELIDVDHYAKDNIQNHLDEIEELWQEVKIKADERGIARNYLFVISIYDHAYTSHTP